MGGADTVRNVKTWRLGSILTVLIVFLATLGVAVPAAHSADIATGVLRTVLTKPSMVTLVKPGFRQTVTTTTALRLPVGTYSVYNTPVAVAGGIYRPVVGVGKVVLTAAGTTYHPAYIFTAMPTGLVTVMFTTPGQVTLTGALQRQTFSKTSTVRLVAGTYTMTTTAVTTAGGVYRPPNVHASAQISVRANMTTVLKPAFVRTALPCAKPAPTTAGGYASLLYSLDKTGAWASGDGHLGVQLHDGRTLVVFGDSVAGPIISGVVHPSGIRHSLAVEFDKGCVKTLPPNSKINQSWLQDDSEKSYYWPTALSRAEIGGQSYLYVFASRMVPVTTGFGFDSTGTDLFVFADNDGLAPKLIRKVPTPSSRAPATVTNWGIASLVDGDKTWIWGAKFQNGAWGKEIWVRSAPTATLANLATWTAPVKIFDFGQCAPATYNAHKTPTGVRLVGKECDGFGQMASAWDSQKPTGPYSKTDLFAAPSDFAAGPYTYCPAAYPWIRLDNGKVLAALSHNNIKFSLWDMLVRYKEQRPSFYAIDWPGV